MSEVQSKSAEVKCPPGCVERVLNYRERNLLIGAARDHCGKKENADFKNQSKLDRLTKLVAFIESLEYFEMLDDHYDDKVREWKSAKRAYTAWMNFKAGLLPAEELRKAFPVIDIEKGAPKPPLRQPEMNPQEMRGEERAFYLPSKLDSWVQDLLKTAIWQPLAAEYAVELCGKFGLKDEDA